MLSQPTVGIRTYARRRCCAGGPFPSERLRPPAALPTHLVGGKGQLVVLVLVVFEVLGPGHNRLGGGARGGGLRREVTFLTIEFLDSAGGRAAQELEPLAPAGEQLQQKRG